MKKLKSICIKIFLMCILFGAILTLAGFFMGAGKKINKNINSSFKENQLEEAEFSENYSDIQNLDISLAFTELILKEGDTFSVTGIGVNQDKLELENNNGTLKIEQKQHSLWDKFSLNFDDGIQIGINESKKSQIVVTIPKNTSLKQVILEVGAGTMNVSDLNCDTLDIEVGAGKGNVSNVSVAEQSDIEVGAGILSISKFIVNKLELECGMGKIIMDGSIEKSCIADCGMGNIDMELNGNIEEYSYSVECGMGEVKVNEDHYSGLGTSKEKGTGEKKLDLECGMGSIKVTIQ